MKASIITIGDEILIGQIVDTNSSWIAQQLNLAGIWVQSMLSVGDDPEAITEALKNGLETGDLLIFTGGLGPTKDDITVQTFAGFFDSALVFDEPTFAHITRFFEKLGRSPGEAHRRQCYLPEKASLLPNSMGTAPGMWFDYHSKVVVSLPGVPYEMKYLMEKEVLPRLQDKFDIQAVVHRTILTAGEGESRIAERIESFENQLPDFIKLAYLPNLGQVRLRLTAKGSDAAYLQQVVRHKTEELVQLIPDLVFGYDKESLEEVLGKLLVAKKLTLTTAESCTGGLIGHTLTSVAGSSAYYQGGLVAYSNDLKIQHLGVSESTLTKHGAVSEATVQEMVSGALEAYRADIAIAVSGIAGPGGGTPQKPVGTIWVAIGNRHHTKTKRLQLGKDRMLNIKYTATFALNMARQFILRHYPEQLGQAK